MKPKLTLALVALITGTAFGSMPAVLPEFKDAKQLAAWRAEMAANSTPQTTATEDHAFYTGKPYVEESGGYAFKYRSYNPEMARWTSEDPSGFPDGANGNCYAPTPTTQFDYCGLNAGDVQIVGAVIEGWEGLGYTLAPRLANHSMEQGGDRTALADEISALKGADEFTSVFNKSGFDTYFGCHGSGTYNHTQVIAYGGMSDVHYAFGKVAFEITVGVTSISSGFRYDVGFSFADLYDFAPTSTATFNPIRAFNNLQQLGIASIFVTSGTFSITYE